MRGLRSQEQVGFVAKLSWLCHSDLVLGRKEWSGPPACHVALSFTITLPIDRMCSVLPSHMLGCIADPLLLGDSLDPMHPAVFRDSHSAWHREVGPCGLGRHS